MKTATKTLPRESWTEARLQKLYARYNKRYWKGRLPEFKVLNCEMPEEHKSAVGLYIKETKTVIIDVAREVSDRQVRSTMLHEMCHVAVGKGGHGARFFEQLERLLRVKAPITVGSPETGSRAVLDARMVLKKFKLCRRAIGRVAAIVQRQLKAEWERAKAYGTAGEEYLLTPEIIASEFYDASALQGLGWKVVYLAIGEEYGLLDIDDQPLPGNGDWLDRARKAHQKGRRFWLENR